MEAKLVEAVHNLYGTRVDAGFPVGVSCSLTKADLSEIWGRNPENTAKHSQYVVSWKADGERMLWVFCEQGVMLVTRDWNFRVCQGWTHADQDLLGTLVDVEIVPPARNQLGVTLILACDLVAVHGRRCSGYSYARRLQVLETWMTRTFQKQQADRVLCTPTFPDCFGRLRRVPMFVMQPQVLLALKPCFLVRQAPALLREPVPFATDGLLYTPVADEVGKFRCPRVKTWKPAHLLTVDFYVRRGLQEEIKDRKEHPWNTFQTPAGPLALFTSDRNLFSFAPSSVKFQSQGVYECAWVSGGWAVLRLKPKRRKADAWPSLLNVLQSLCDPVTPNDLLPT